MTPTPLKVLKFGGTSMGSPAALLQSAQLVEREPGPVLVVVSATSGTTNAILAALQARSRTEIEAIAHRHGELARALELNAPELQAALDDEIDTLHEAIVGDSNALETIDRALACGERLSSRLFAALLAKRGRSVQWKDAGEVLETDANFGKAEPQLAETAARAETHWGALARSRETWVTQGFIGRDAEGRLTTLGRGGSDYSAALFGEALRASEVQIWTDVPGVLTTDPNAVASARPISEMTFAEASELAAFGAKVLHPATLWPAIRQDIPVFVGSTFAPERGGTWIRRALAKLPDVRAIALRKRQTLITVTSPRMLNAYGFLANVFSVLARHRVSVDLVTTSEVSIALTIDAASGGSAGASVLENRALLDELAAFGEVATENGLDLVAVVGNRFSTTPGLSSRIFGAVHPANARLICHGASDHNVCFLVAANESLDVLRRLHEQLIEAAPTP